MNTDVRTISHMDLDTFFVSVERLLDSRLKGRPVLIGGVSDRGVVASCSYEARAFGVHSAMPMKQARQLCPEAVVVRGNSATYTEHSRMVTEIIRERVPIFEKSSIDEFYLDLTGMDKFFGCLKWATELRQTIIKETGLPISFGMAVNKTVSKVATGEAKPNNQRHIPVGGEKPFLAPLSVRKIPMVGEKTYQTLCNLGIKRIRTLQEMPPELPERFWENTEPPFGKRPTASTIRPWSPTARGRASPPNAPSTAIRWTCISCGASSSPWPKTSRSSCGEETNSPPAWP